MTIVPSDDDDVTPVALEPAPSAAAIADVLAIADAPYCEGLEVRFEDDAVDPDERCLAATGAPVDAARRCPVHADGSHHCCDGPGHQAAKSAHTDRFIFAQCAHDVPEWATHVCDCHFRWTCIAQ